MPTLKEKILYEKLAVFISHSKRAVPGYCRNRSDDSRDFAICGIYGDFTLLKSSPVNRRFQAACQPCYATSGKRGQVEFTFSVEHRGCNLNQRDNVLIGTDIFRYRHKLRHCRERSKIDNPALAWLTGQPLVGRLWWDTQAVNEGRL